MRCALVLTVTTFTGTAAQQDTTRGREQEQERSAPGIKNIILVHGAWADGSSWSKVIPLLEARGFHVVAVQNHLATFEDDVATTKRAIAVQDGPVLRRSFVRWRRDYASGNRSQGRGTDIRGRVGT